MRNEETVPKRVREISRSYPDHAVLYSKDVSGKFQPLSYAAFWRRIGLIGQALIRLGVRRADHVGIISDNRPEWIMTDMAILGLGAVDVPRGSDSTPDEIAYILGHAECGLAFAENRTQLEKILSRRERLPLLEKIVLFDFSTVPAEADHGIEILAFNELIAEADCAEFEREVDLGRADDTATIIYTSGTTGEPKGVMLHHRSFLFQLDKLPEVLFLKPGHIFLSVLPIWHSFERSVEYYVLAEAAALAYSRPIGKIMLEDMAAMQPHWMASVPRIWEGVRSAVYRSVNAQGGAKKILFHFFVAVGEAHAYLHDMARGLLPRFDRRSRIVDVILSCLPLLLLTPMKLLADLLVFKAIKARLGGRFVAGVSGGGSLPPYVDRFFQAVGIMLLEGYGLTETGPILSVRRQKAPVRGTVGPLLDEIEYKVLSEDGSPVEPGEKGLLWVRSPQVMRGYYKRPEETSAVIQDGWLNTGDLCRFTHRGEFKIIGRSKETIVLLGGENVEPTPIEEAMLQSEYIDQVMVVGQDQKYLAALIVANPEKIEALAAARGVSYMAREELIENPVIQDEINSEIQNLICARTGFKVFERVYRFRLMPKPFQVGVELTNSMKLRRNVAAELYRKEIAELFSSR